jgi:signal transduction histidine kinase
LEIEVMMLRKLANKKWLTLTAVVVAVAALTTAFLCHRATAFPYRDTFANNQAGEWTPLGGAWQLSDGVVYNRSDERGAKLVSGSPEWTNYQLSAELKLIGHQGDVGVIVRLGEEERGIDSYRGYYIGLRANDSALLIGRADHGWIEGQPVPMQGGVQMGVWYRLRIVAVGCHIGAEATNIETGQTTWSAFADQPCIEYGKIGLRSMATGGAWRNVSVTAANDAAWEQIRAHAAFLQEPRFPIREDDYSRMREQYFKSTYRPVRTYQPDTLVGVGEEEPDASPPQLGSIEDIRTTPVDDARVAIRGVVTLTSPLYVQDSTGSIAVQLRSPVELNLGDEVEILGNKIATGYTPQLVAESVRLLWDRTLVEPISITSTEAASGEFDASLVELRGKLRSKSMDRNGNITLQLYDSAQTFSATVRGGLSTLAFRSWEPGSDLAIRGICTISPVSGRRGVAFTIQMRAIDDVQVLSGPPWWTGRQLIRLSLLCLALIGLAVYAFIRLERWKMHAIIGERERLAHDMHDTLAQSFAGVGFHLQGLCNGMRTGSADRADVIAMLHRACDMVSHSHREASACIAALHPDADQGGDFLTALDRCAREMLDGDHRNAKALPVRFVREGVARPLSIPIRDALFHVGREAITNMLRHAQATEMELRLLYQADGVVLEIYDNGLGFEYDSQASGFGIRTMQSRCTKVKAKIVIESAVGKGTRVVVAAPYGLGPRSIDWVRSLRTRLPYRM